MRLGRILAVGFVALIALIVLANEFMSWRVNAQVRAKIAAIRAAGDPASLADLTPKPIAETENAAEVLYAVGPRLREFSKEYGTFFDSRLGKAFDSRSDQGLEATPEQIAAIKSILDRYPDIDAALAVAAACPKYASVDNFDVPAQQFLKDSLDGQIGDVRTAQRFLAWRMKALLAAGKQDDAVKLGIQCLQISRLWGEEPLLNNGLVGFAIRDNIVHSIYDGLAAGKISAATHAALDQELALDDDPQRLTHILKTERGFSISMMDDMEERMVDAGPFSTVLKHLFGWTFKRYGIGMMDYYDYLLPRAGKPWPDVAQDIAPTKTPGTGRFGVFAEMGEPSMESLFTANARDLALVRALRVFNAARKFSEDNGREAGGLGDLAIPKDAAIDPFDGRPLKMKMTADGWIVYSVMKNGVDDGGDFMDMKDFGVAPRKLRETDKRADDAAAAEAGAEAGTNAK